MSKRVLVFSTAYFPMVGGAEVAMKELTDRMTDVRFDLICAKIQPGLSSRETIGRVVVHRVGFGKPLDKYLLPLFGVIRAWFVIGFQPVVIWSLTASYNGFASLVYRWTRPDARMLLTLQEGDPLEHYAKRVGKLMVLHRRIFATADALQAISRFLADWGVKMGFRHTPVVVPNGVETASFSKSISAEERRRIRESFGFSDADRVLVTTSRLSLKNGVDDLLRSLIYLPSSYKTLIVGDGEDREKLLSLVEQKGLTDRVVFAGLRSRAEIPSLLHASDVFVRASLSEGLGNSFLEAMSAGLPVIGTPVGGIPDFLHDGETGVFCEPRNPESIAQAVLRLDADPALRARVIKSGAELVVREYTWNDIAKRIRAMLADLGV